MEIEEDRVQIRLGRSAERHFGKVQNIIIMVDDQDITSEDNVPGLGKMNIVIKDGEIIVGDIFIPEKYRKQGIATTVYQKISDYFGLPIVNSKTKGFNQTMEGGYIWKKRNRFEPRNLQEHIRRVLREEIDFTSVTQLKRRGYLIDKAFKNNLKHLSPDKFSSREKYFNTLIEYTLRDLHGDYFVYSELPDEEWDEYKDYIIKYIKSNYDI